MKSRNNHRLTRKSKIILFGIRQLYVLLFLLIFIGCKENDKELSDSFPESCYINLRLNLVSDLNSRNLTDKTQEGSETQESYKKTEKGKDSELNIKFLQLIFWDDEKSKCIASLYGSPNQTTTFSSDNSATVKIQIKPEDFKSAIIKAGEVKVYVIINGDNIFDEESFDPMSSKFQYSSYGFSHLKGFSDTNNIPYVNADEYTADFTGITDENFNSFLESLSDYTLSLTKSDEGDFISEGDFKGTGTISLERAVARIDYKFSHEDETGNLYRLEETGIYMKITGIQPINVSRETYLFRHVITGDSKSAKDSEWINANLFKPENVEDENSCYWIMDTDWNKKNKRLYTSNFLNPPTDNNEWIDIPLPPVENNSIPICYVSENTLPSTETMIQGLSTGVTFRAVLCDKSGEPLSKDDLVSQGGSGSKMISIEENTDGSLKLSYAGKEAIATPLSAEDDISGYSLTYYYWIQHNNESDSPAITDPMEFAVVRNHIYKLSIESIHNLPDPYNPESPDENYSIRVNVRVNPWNYQRLEIDW